MSGPPFLWVFQGKLGPCHTSVRSGSYYYFCPSALNDGESADAGVEERGGCWWEGGCGGELHSAAVGQPSVQAAAGTEWRNPEPLPPGSPTLPHAVRGAEEMVYSCSNPGISAWRDKMCHVSRLRS